MLDLTRYPVNKDKTYAGSERKISILINNEPYIVKFQKNSITGLRYNHISEYLGSHIFDLLGMPVQKTLLGVYNNENIVAMKDFRDEDEKFVPFNDVGEISLDVDKNSMQYSYSQIMTLLSANKKLTNVKETIDIFWQMFIVDAFIGNFDRHGMNWGFLKKDDKYRLSPVFDNGSSLYPQLNDEKEMERIINDEEEINKRVYDFPTSQIKLNRKKSSYYEVINSLKFKECNKALKEIFPRINLEKIYELIDGVDNISDLHKKFYKVMLENRYEKIIKASYLKLQNGEING